MTRLLSTQPTPSPWLVSCCSSCGYELSSLHTTRRQRVKVCVRARKEPTQREKDRWGSAKMPFTFMSCRIPCASPLCALARLRIFAFSHVAGLFALFGESATNLDWGPAQSLLRISCSSGSFGQTSFFHKTLVDLLM